MLTDWLMVGITFVYVVATILICVYNAKSSKTTKEQVAESKRQFEESKRLETMPFLQLEILTNRDRPQFEIELDLCDGNKTETIYRDVRLKNLGNGSASNIIYTWERKNDSSVKCDYLPINGIMHGDSYCVQLTINVEEYNELEEVNGDGVLTWQFDDLLGNSYKQKVCLIIKEGEIVRCENDIPRYLGVVKYYIPEKSEKTTKNGE